MRKIAVAVTLLVAFSAPAAFAIGIPAKMKAKKVQGTLVPAYHPSDSGPGTGNDEGDSPAFLDTAVESGACSFVSGQFKLQVGKDASVKMKGVECGGTPYTGQLCAHSKQLATIMSEEIAKDGSSSAVTCTSTAGPIEGDINFSTGNIGLISCTDGKCQGTLPVVISDPCPAVDKVSQVSRMEVFDGPDMTSQSVLGSTLAACCGTGQTLVGGTLASGFAPCNASSQEAMAEMGTVVQGVTP